MYLLYFLQVGFIEFVDGQVQQFLEDVTRQLDQFLLFVLVDRFEHEFFAYIFRDFI